MSGVRTGGLGGSMGRGQTFAGTFGDGNKCSSEQLTNVDAVMHTVRFHWHSPVIYIVIIVVSGRWFSRGRGRRDYDVMTSRAPVDVRVWTCTECGKK